MGLIKIMKTFNVWLSALSDVESKPIRSGFRKLEFFFLGGKWTLTADLLL